MLVWLSWEMELVGNVEEIDVFPFGFKRLAAWKKSEYVQGRI